VSRTRSREIAYRILFALGTMAENNVEVLLEMACEGETDKPTGMEREYINRVVKVAIEHMNEVDEVIKKLVRDPIERIFKTDLTALRLGIAEIKYTECNAPAVIKETVEIAKRYGTEKSAGFVNGVLAKAV